MLDACLPDLKNRKQILTAYGQPTHGYLATRSCAAAAATYSLALLVTRLYLAVAASLVTRLLSSHSPSCMFAGPTEPKAAFERPAHRSDVMPLSRASPLLLPRRRRAAPRGPPAPGEVGSTGQMETGGLVMQAPSASEWRVRA